MIFWRFEDVFCLCLHWISWSSPYFYFQSSWPTDLESVSRDAYLTLKVCTKFEVDTIIRCLVIALLLLVRYVTWFCDFNLWPFDLGQLSYTASHVISPSAKFEDPMLSVLELWVLPSPIGYQWQCVCCHCACAVSRDVCVKGIPTFEIPHPDLPIHYTTFMALRWR